MTATPLSRASRARARAAERKRTELAALKRQRAAQRYGKGPLRDRVVRPQTLKQYRVAVKSLFQWCKVNGYVIPRRMEDIDTLLCGWTEIPRRFSQTVSAGWRI